MNKYNLVLIGLILIIIGLVVIVFWQRNFVQLQPLQCPQYEQPFA
jgi:hypothetical protein